MSILVKVEYTDKVVKMDHPVRSSSDPPWIGLLVSHSTWLIYL